MQKKWQIKIAPSLGGGFAGTPQDVWGVEEYKDDTKPTVFFGLYGFPDFYHLWRHKGEKAILWAGSDIRHFLDGYWLDDKGKIRMKYEPLAEWIDKNCNNYVENDVEKNALAKAGISSKVVPSFLGDVNDYPLCYKHNFHPKVYTSVSGDDFKLYGWDKIPRLAKDNPDIEFHLYGNKKSLYTKAKNIIVHGRVSQEEMNREIKDMQGALRLTEFEGFSEIIAKSLLWGQYPISTIKCPHTLRPSEIKKLRGKFDPNLGGREWVLKNVNQYKWNDKIN